MPPDSRGASATGSASASTSSDRFSAHACRRCSERKVKCNKEHPQCSNCARHGVPCVPHIASDTAAQYSTPTSRKRKQRFPEAELLRRISLYERTLDKLGVNVPRLREATSPPDETPQSSSPSLARSGLSAEHSGSFSHFDREELTLITGTLAPDPPQEEEDFSPTSSASSSLPSPEHNSTKQTAASANAPTPQPVRIGVQPNIISAFFNGLFDDHGATKLFYAPPAHEKPPPHPEAFMIWKIWQLYIDRVHPLLKVLHVPSMQRKIIDIGSRLNEDDGRAVSPLDHALLFAIYSVAAVAIPEHQKAQHLGCQESDTQALAESFHAGVRYWLNRTDMWRSGDVRLVQTLLLYTCILQNMVDPRTVTCFMGIVERIMRRLALHAEPFADKLGIQSPSASASGSQSKLTSKQMLDIEIRRRLWWEFVAIDLRAQERAAFEGGPLVEYHHNRRLPSALSDADLERADQSRHAPPRAPSMDGLMTLMRAHITYFRAKLYAQSDRLPPGHDAASLSSNLGIIDELETTLREQIWLHCQDGRALSTVLVQFGKCQIARLRLSAYGMEERTLTRRTAAAAGQPASNGPALAASLSNIRSCQVKMVEEGFIAVESFCSIWNHKECRDTFGWFTALHVPFIAFVRLLGLLRVYTAGESVDKCWRLFEDTDGVLFQTPAIHKKQMAKSQTSSSSDASTMDAQKKMKARPPTILFWALFKAWEARRRSLNWREGVDVEPDYIRRLRAEHNYYGPCQPGSGDTSTSTHVRAGTLNSQGGASSDGPTPSVSLSGAPPAYASLTNSFPVTAASGSATAPTPTTLLPWSDLSTTAAQNNTASKDSNNLNSWSAQVPPSSSSSSSTAAALTADASDILINLDLDWERYFRETFLPHMGVGMDEASPATLGYSAAAATTSGWSGSLSRDVGGGGSGQTDEGFDWGMFGVGGMQE